MHHGAIKTNPRFSLHFFVRIIGFFSLNFLMAFRGDHNSIFPSNDGKNMGMLLRPLVQFLQDYLQKSFDKSLLQYGFFLSNFLNGLAWCFGAWWFGYLGSHLAPSRSTLNLPLGFKQKVVGNPVYIGSTPHAGFQENHQDDMNHF